MTKRYMFRHPAEQWTAMVNHDLEHSGDQDWVLRTRGDTLLGIVSASYKKFDKREVVKAPIENLGEEAKVRRHHVDERFFFVRIVRTFGRQGASSVLSFSTWGGSE